MRSANDITQDDARVVRARARLRGGQGAALRVREVRRRRSAIDHADEVGRRVDGDRAHLQGSAPKGPARAGGRARRDGRSARPPADDRVDRRDARGAARRAASARRPSGSSSSSGRSWRAFRSHDLHEITGDRSLVPLRDGRAGRGGAMVRGAVGGGGVGRGGPPDDEADGLQRPAAGAHARRDRGARARMAARRAGASRIQDGGYLRGRVPLVDAVSLRELRRGERSPAHRAPVGSDSGQRAEPDRAGRRVRLLLRAGGHRTPRHRGSRRS